MQTSVHLFKIIPNKNAFQWDAYHLLVDHIPACTARGVSARVSTKGGVLTHPLGPQADTPPHPRVDRQTPVKT